MRLCTRLQLKKGKAKMFNHIGGKNRPLRLALSREFCSAPTNPGTDGGGLVNSNPLPDQRCTDAREHIPPASRGHAGVARGVVERVFMHGGNDGSGTFEKDGVRLKILSRPFHLFGSI